MRIAVDARWVRIGVPDGISRFTANLTEELARTHAVTMLISDSRQREWLPRNAEIVRINNPLSLAELRVGRTLNQLNCDVVFSPLQVIGGGVRREYKLILTLHDLIYHRFSQPPRFLPWWVRAVWWLYHQSYWPQRWMLNRADAVVTVSHTARQAIDQHRLTSRPVTVVSNAPAQLPESPSTASIEDTATRQPELVYVGSFLGYKNVETLLAGMPELPGYRLHLVSQIAPARQQELERLVGSLGCHADVVFWNGISESDYRTLLHRATALVTASLEEGFGLPIVEAMNAGIPVVCSDIPIFREVTGGHARFFDPHAPREFAQAVHSVGEVEREKAGQNVDARNDGERAALVNAARQFSQRYSWQNSADALADLIHSMITASRP